MNDYKWYDLINADEPLGQGDVILDCPLLTWIEGAEETLEKELGEDPEQLGGLLSAELLSVVVMTQACDLSQNKVRNVVLCPAYQLSDHKQAWEEGMRSTGNIPSDKAWKSHFNKIRNGYVWNFAAINSGSASGLNLEEMIIDFHEVYSLPRIFIERFLKNRGEPRFRLAPPYREHLSQSFARFFMRVGLPVPIPKA